MDEISLTHDPIFGVLLQKALIIVTPRRPRNTVGVRLSFSCHFPILGANSVLMYVI